MGKITQGSWVESANRPGNDFPIENLPYGTFRRSAPQQPARTGIAIGDQILDFTSVAEILGAEVIPAPLRQGDLNAFMAMGPSVRQSFRHQLTGWLGADASEASRLKAALVPQSDVQMQLPCRIGDYTDFYASIHHATQSENSFGLMPLCCRTISGYRLAITAADHRSA